MTEQPHEATVSRHQAGSEMVDRGLILRLRVYLLIFAISGVLTLVDGIRQGSNAAVPVVVCFVVALALGVLASRVSRLSWDHAAKQVVGRIDALGIVVLIGYVLLVIFKKRLLANWFAPSLVGVGGVAVLAGLMLGQALGTAGGVARVLHVARPKSGNTRG